MRIMIKSIIGIGIIAAAVGIPAPEVDMTVNKEKAVPIPVIEKSWKCEDCTPEEQYVLEQLQENTRISDPNALATIMGNIKQESNFVANVCEGGERVDYKDCNVGGYGLIQWTSVGRYNYEAGMVGANFMILSKTIRGDFLLLSRCVQQVRCFARKGGDSALKACP